MPRERTTALGTEAAARGAPERDVRMIRTRHVGSRTAFPHPSRSGSRSQEQLLSRRELEVPRICSPSSSRSPASRHGSVHPEPRDEFSAPGHGERRGPSGKRRARGHFATGVLKQPEERLNH